MEDLLILSNIQYTLLSVRRPMSEFSNIWNNAVKKTLGKRGEPVWSKKVFILYKYPR